MKTELDTLHIQKRVSDVLNEKWEIGVSTSIIPNNPVEAIKKLLESNLALSLFELDLCTRVEQKPIKNELVKLKKENDLTYSVHVPWLYDDLAHPHPGIRETHIDEAKKTISFASKIKAKSVVLHPGRLFFRDTLPPVKKLSALKLPRDHYFENSLNSLRKIGKFSADYETKLYLENLPFGLCKDPKETKSLIQLIQNMSFLLDIGHANISGGLDKFLDLRPNYFHFHDNHGEEDEHLELGAGNIDLANLLQKISAYKSEKKTIILELYYINGIKGSFRKLDRTFASLD